jgi:hypothetical protein
MLMISTSMNETPLIKENFLRESNVGSRVTKSTN